MGGDLGLNAGLGPAKPPSDAGEDPPGAPGRAERHAHCHADQGRYPHADGADVRGPAAGEPLMRTPPQRAGVNGRRPKPRADRRGVALVMVLGAITVLTVFLTELQEETSAELSSALAERDAVRAEYYAR